MTVGPSEAIDATALLLALAERGAAANDGPTLRGLLRPVLVKRREQRELFDAVFDRWWQAPRTTPPAAAPAASEAQPAQVERGGWSLAAWMAGATLVIGAIGWWALRSEPTEPAPSTATTPAEGAAARPSYRTAPPAPAPADRRRRPADRGLYRSHALQPRASAALGLAAGVAAAGGPVRLQPAGAADRAPAAGRRRAADARSVTARDRGAQAGAAARSVGSRPAGAPCACRRRRSAPRGTPAAHRRAPHRRGHPAPARRAQRALDRDAAASVVPPARRHRPRARPARPAVLPMGIAAGAPGPGCGDPAAACRPFRRRRGSAGCRCARQRRQRRRAGTRCSGCRRRFLESG